MSALPSFLPSSNNSSTPVKLVVIFPMSPSGQYLEITLVGSSAVLEDDIAEFMAGRRHLVGFVSDEPNAPSCILAKAMGPSAFIRVAD